MALYLPISIELNLIAAGLKKTRVVEQMFEPHPIFLSK